MNRYAPVRACDHYKRIALPVCALVGLSAVAQVLLGGM